MINSVIPGILSGNAIILKPSPQTPTPAERLARTLTSAGLPANVVQVVHLPQELVANLATDSRIGFLSFTGSVRGGRDLEKAAALHDAEDSSVGFKGVGLELGGKDPAYVREDVDVKWAADQLVDGEVTLLQDQSSGGF
jgi:acyl-CoA reductase-like NAD-dependent aldehyde dehydrogenase